MADLAAGAGSEAPGCFFRQSIPGACLAGTDQMPAGMSTEIVGNGGKRRRRQRTFDEGPACDDG
ncbi:hypothetical protein O9K51_08161 [Purpureocillium lavendulum]|uniref:Uncharacterized protein n=1 Tax=Purpureocillium lavendulum TaxID=1247861 RepID=A0AB34FHR2_9HYPO|nr:hypothetical protein O9K51_08161 [Purpureocillium lavendulum]